MTWRIAAATGGPLLIVALALAGGGCGGVFGRSASPTPTFTPAPTHTPTLTPTATATATPTATPTPSLPPNPDALQRWDDLPIAYCVAATDAGYVEATELIALSDRALAAWGVPVVNEGSCAGVADEDGRNEIGWGDLGGASGRRGRGLYEAGVTSVHYEECTSRCDPDDPVHIIEADITIDADPPREFRSADCLYSTLLHEAGHFLGLSHLDPPAVMAPETETCPDALTDADIEALRARYGARATPAE